MRGFFKISETAAHLTAGHALTARKVDIEFLATTNPLNACAGGIFRLTTTSVYPWIFRRRVW